MHAESLRLEPGTRADRSGIWAWLTSLQGWIDARRLDHVSAPVVLVWIALAAILLAALWLPFAVALVCCAGVGLLQTVWFWCGLVMSNRTLGPRDLGLFVLAWGAGLWWWTVFVYTLWDQDILRFTEPDADVAEITAFFLWHLLDLVPFIDIDGTFRWRMPLDYTQVGVGACVLMYQAFVVLPVIALVRRALKQRSDGGQPSSPEP